MSFTNFKSFIDAHPYIQEIELSNFGEPFLNPEIIQICKYGFEKKVLLMIANGTNFNAPTDEVLEALVKYQVRCLVIAIDGACQSTYEKYRIGGNYDKVIENIEKILFFKKKHFCSFPKLIWQFVIMEHNEEEVLKAKKEAARLGIDIYFKLTWDKNYKPKNPEKLKTETGLIYLTEKDYQNAKTDPYMSACHQMWVSPQINWDGRLLGCCYVAANDYETNVFEVGLERALRSSKYVAAQKFLEQKISFEEAKKLNIPCLSCQGKVALPLNPEKIWRKFDENRT